MGGLRTGEGVGVGAAGRARGASFAVTCSGPEFG